MFDKFTCAFVFLAVFFLKRPRTLRIPLRWVLNIFEVVKRRSHADKQWSLDEIRV